MKTGSIAIACITTVLLATLVACDAGAPVANSEVSAPAVDSGNEFVHPPYDEGVGHIDGTLVRSATATYPAGSLQEPTPFTVIVVAWDGDGMARRSEFIISGDIDLVVDGNVERLATVQRVLEVLDRSGSGVALEVGYAGADLAPTWYSTPPADYPHAVVTTITVGLGS